MRYVRPREFRHNPRQSVTLLDPVAHRFEQSRLTFTEQEALADIWKRGEEVRLREDQRFWELEGLEHFHLFNQRLANDLLATRLWQGVWDGQNLTDQLTLLDENIAGEFHVFCSVDPRFIKKDGQFSLTLRPQIKIPKDICASLDSFADQILQRHRELGLPMTTLQFRERLTVLGTEWPVGEEGLDLVDAWLRQRSEWTEIARSFWLPTDSIPVFEAPKLFRVLQVRGEEAGDSREESRPGGPAPTTTTEIGRVADPPDPPVERQPDCSVSWTHILRTIHLNGYYLPVPTGARFRYPRFVGTDGMLAIRCVEHDSGREGFLWLDRQNHHFFGELLQQIVEWEEAGRKLKLEWRPEAVVIRRGDIDHAVHEEESRHVDPKALYELRLGKGESYRQALASILRNNPEGLEFRTVSEELARRAGHRPSRSTIRTVLSQSPEFFFVDGRWHWKAVADGARVLRRRLVLTSLANISQSSNDLDKVADAVSRMVAELVPNIPASPRVTSTIEEPKEARFAALIIPFERGKEPPRGTVPLYPLMVAAGPFRANSEGVEPQGFVPVSHKGNLSGYFAAYVTGRSMEPLIPDGALCLFRRQMGGVAGSRQGRVLLARHRAIDDPETGASFTVKRYKRMTPIDDDQSREKIVVQLVPENPDFKPIIIETSPEDTVDFIAEFVQVL